MSTAAGFTGGPSPEQALYALRCLTACYCDSPWTDRGLHETHCSEQYREDVEVLARAAGYPSDVIQ